MNEICVFWDELEDGWGRVTHIHHQPDRLDDERKARGLVITPNPRPKLKKGWTSSLWVNPELGTYEYRIEVDDEYRIPAGEFLATLPIQTRVNAKALAESDPILSDFLDLLDMMVQDSASKGLHPGGEIVAAGLAYLVHLELLDQAWVDEAVSPLANG
jgi:hypothetical protein